MNVGDRVVVTFGGVTTKGTVVEPPSPDAASRRFGKAVVSVGNGRTVVVPADCVADMPPAPAREPQRGPLPVISLPANDRHAELVAATAAMASKTEAAKAAIDQAAADKAAAANN